jgi:hypothetical protein
MSRPIKRRRSTDTSESEVAVATSSSPVGERPQIARRTFIKISGLSFGALSFPLLPGCGDDANEGLPDPGTLGFVVTALRPRDFVALRFAFYGLELNDEGDQLVSSGRGERLIVVTHASQHLLEEALLEKDGAHGDLPTPTKQPVQALLGGTSRVVFKVPSDVRSLDYDLVELLEACGAYEMKVSPNAAPPATTPAIVVPSLQLATPSRAALRSTIVRASLETVTEHRQAEARRRIARSSGLDLVTSAAIDPRVADVIASVSPGEPRAPGDTETAIELPFRLLISPNHLGGWAHATSPVEHNGRTELWHSRLGVRRQDGTVDEQQAYLRSIRAIWARDLDRPALPAVPFEATLTRENRTDLVRNTADFRAGTPLPAEVSRLMLSGLGGYLDADGSWDDAPRLERWVHRAALGRDHYVKVVEKGYLYPFGHRAVLVTITERKLERPDGYTPGSGPDPEHVAFLWKRQLIIVREPVKSYAASHRELPFTAVHVRDRVTPLLDGPIPASAPFVPRVDTAPYRFAMEGIDRGGGVLRFDAAVAFVRVDMHGNAQDDGAAMLYASHNAVDLAGQRMAFAEADEPDDTSFDTQRLYLEAVPDGSGNQQPGFVPALDKADVYVEAIRQLSGQDQPAEVRYHASYVGHGFGGQNAAGQVLFEVAGDGIDMAFSGQSDRSGGFLSPDMSVKGLSRSKGPVSGDVDAFAGGNLNPSDFFDRIDAKIFGVFELKDIIQHLTSEDGALDNAPRFVTQALDQVEGFVHDLSSLLHDLPRYTAQLANVPGALSSAIGAVENAHRPLSETTPSTLADLTAALGALATALDALRGQPPAGLGELLHARAQRIQDVIDAGLGPAIEAYRAGRELAKDLTVRLEWRPKIQGFGGIFVPNREDGLLLSLEARGKDSPGKPAGVDLVACIEDFHIHLIGQNAFLRIPFERLEFKVSSGKKPEIDVAFGLVRFDGVLAFVQKLADVIPADGLSEGPDIELTTEGITAGITLALPNLAVGIFSLENLSFSARFNIPFIGPPITTRFAFCSREQPFVLTVSMLGGGGFFAITASPRGVEILEAALEFGARLSMDLGVASGSLSIAAGMYFLMEDNQAELTGYLRLRGEVSVLRIVRIAIEILMELLYEFSSRKVVGRATVEVEVSVLCFSGSVKIKVERKFAGSNGDPTFAELMAPEGDARPWDEYLAAFAA